MMLGGRISSSAAPRLLGYTLHTHARTARVIAHELVTQAVSLWRISAALSAPNRAI